MEENNKNNVNEEEFDDFDEYGYDENGYWNGLSEEDKYLWFECYSGGDD